MLDDLRPPLRIAPTPQSMDPPCVMGGTSKNVQDDSASIFVSTYAAVFFFVAGGSQCGFEIHYLPYTDWT